MLNIFVFRTQVVCAKHLCAAYSVRVVGAKHLSVGYSVPVVGAKHLYAVCSVRVAAPHESATGCVAADVTEEQPPATGLRRTHRRSEHPSHQQALTAHQCLPN